MSMRHPLLQRHTRGFSFVEMIVTAALIALVFGGLMSSVQFALKLLSTSKGSNGASALATGRLEYIRSLSYDAVGTVGGIPNGSIPQTSTTSLNGVVYHERVLISYVDSPDDGTGASDTNGILADYKQVKVEYSWQDQNGTSTIFLLSNIVPPGIESTSGGGTLAVNVFDANIQPVSGAEVFVYNNTTTSTISTIRYTNVDGVALFSGAPAAANYEITVSKTGYSTDQTYTATTSNPNPLTPPVAVLAGAVSTMNFQIDERSNLLVRTVGPSTDGLFSDSFVDTSLIASSSAITVASDDATLSGSVGSYAPLGTLWATSTEPSSISAWDVFDWNATVPGNTTLRVQLYSVSSGGVYTLVPDADLAGNSAGFDSGPVSLSSLDPGTYPSLALGATLTSNNVSVTPRLHDWRIDYIISEPSIGSVPFTLTGSKLIGSTPIYKYQEDQVTDSSGESDLQGLEWDLYDIDVTGGTYDISDACARLPYALNPGVSETLTLTLVPATTNSLRIHVTDTDGNPVIGADVEISRSGFSDSAVTSTCGQTFFSGLSATDHDITVQATGYVDQTITDITVDGTDTLTVTLVDL